MKKPKKALDFIKREPIVANRNGDVQINLSVLIEMRDTINNLVAKSKERVQCDCWKCTDR